jgi:nitroreductase
MDLFKAIAGRHSYRGLFKHEAVPRGDLEKIVQAGIQAPSGWNAQTVTFVIVDAPDILNAIRKILPAKDYPNVASATAIIACTIDPNRICGGHCYTIEDCAAATENMLLAITALGYATVWTDGALRSDNRAERIGELLGVPKDKRVRVLLPLGIPTETGTQAGRRSFTERAWFNRYGG